MLGPGYPAKHRAKVDVEPRESRIQRSRWSAGEGATNPADAALGTIRKDFAESIEANSVHGSDSEENAAIEIAHFFTAAEIVG